MPAILETEFHLMHSLRGILPVAALGRGNIELHLMPRLKGILPVPALGEGKRLLLTPFPALCQYLSQLATGYITAEDRAARAV